MNSFPLKRFTLAVALCLAPSLAFAQRNSSDAASSAAAAACCGTFLFIPILFLVLNIALLVWVARDAKSRGMDNAVLWMILVLCTSIVGLIIYLFSRPQGNLVACANCGNKKLQAAVRCPHCGIGI